jgi:NAD+ diphosphatase
VTPAPNTFAGAGLDRAGEHRRDAGWVAARRADPAARAVVVGSEGVALDGEGRLARLPLPTGADPVLLGIQDGAPLFAVDAAHAPDTRLTGLRDAGARLEQAEGGLAAYAAALLNWHRRHPFCSVCGQPTEPDWAGFVRRCPSCGTEHHPRTDPVVIMLVVDSDRVVLGRQPTWPPGRYSALAGFVEPGETLEEAVAREVREEAGVDVRDPRYVSSQPWPFPSSLMLGFVAQWAGGEPRARDEVEDVRWFDRAEVADAVAGRGTLGLPPPLAIARRLIEGWLAGR